MFMTHVVDEFLDLVTTVNLRPWFCFVLENHNYLISYQVYKTFSQGAPREARPRAKNSSVEDESSDLLPIRAVPPAMRAVAHDPPRVAGVVGLSLIHI